MTYRMLLLVLAVAALIALPAANALADESKDDHVVIIKCREDNTVTAPIPPSVFVAQASTGFTLPASCTPATTNSCANCLRDLISDPLLDCEGDDEFTSNVVADQQSTTADPISINKFVFACGATP